MWVGQLSESVRTTRSSLISTPCMDVGRVRAENCVVDGQKRLLDDVASVAVGGCIFVPVRVPTMSQLAVAADKGSISQDMDETRSIGTSVYVAPEVRSGGSGSYTSKVDVSTLAFQPGVYLWLCHWRHIVLQRRL